MMIIGNVDERYLIIFIQKFVNVQAIFQVQVHLKFNFKTACCLCFNILLETQIDHGLRERLT